MICTHCGKVLKDYDRFCSNCGAIIEQEESRDFVFTAPERDFEWDVHSFPDAVPHKTEDAVFDWGIPEGEFKRRPRENDEPVLREPTIAPVPGNISEQMPVQTDSGQAFSEPRMSPEVQAVPEESIDRKPKEKKGFFARFQRDKDVTIEQPVITNEQIDEAVKQQEQLIKQEQQMQQVQRERHIQVEQQSQQEQQRQPDEFQTKHVEFDWTQQLDPHQEFLAMKERNDSVFDEELFGGVEFENELLDDGSSHMNELREEHEDDIKGEQLERELFGGAAVAGVAGGGEGLSEQTAKIDTFYTLNKKNEEFQKLLDKEYDRFNEGRPLDKDTFSANVEAIRANVENEENNALRSGRMGGIEHMQELNDTIRGNPLRNVMDTRKTMPYQVIGDNDMPASEGYASEEIKPEKGFRRVEDPNADPVHEANQDTAPEIAFKQLRAQSQAEQSLQPQTEQQRSQQQQAHQMDPIVALDDMLHQTASEELSGMTDRIAPSLMQEWEDADADKVSKIKEIFGVDNELSGSEQSVPQKALEDTEERQIPVYGEPLHDPKDQGADIYKEQEDGDTDINEEQGGDPEKEKSGLAGKIAITILSIILVVLLLALGIKLIAPDSSISRQIDNAANRVMNIFTGDDESPQSVNTDTAIDPNYEKVISEG